MAKLPENLSAKLEKRKKEQALRSLPGNDAGMLIDFASNDYLGFARSAEIFEGAHQLLVTEGMKINGATGSRLLTGNHALYVETEKMLQSIHKIESALIFNSGYDANIGLFGSLSQKYDVIIYDEYIHASIRDGIQLGLGKSYKFKHNNPDDLDALCGRLRNGGIQGTLYVVTESVFSMDGDTPDFKALIAVCDKHEAFLIVDEAHALGVLGDSGHGVIQSLQLEDHVFARLVTFGKAMGCHGAAILGSEELKEFLVNFARSFIYTTALPPHALATIQIAYRYLNDVGSSQNDSLRKLQENIRFFQSESEQLKDKLSFIESNSAIHGCIIPGNQHVKHIAGKLREEGFDVKPILSPTVPKGSERLRFCLHSYNTFKEIEAVLRLLNQFL